MDSGQCSICHRVPAKFACSCAFPPISICATCTVVHLESPATHIPISIQKKGSGQSGPMQGANEVCDECRAKTAVRFCLCSVPFKKFCEECDVAHYQKAPGMAHFQYPIAAYQPVASGQIPLETFRRKQLFINDFQLQIGQELNRFDAFSKQVIDEYEALLRQVTAKKEETLRDLQAKRAQLATYLNEVQQTIEAKRYAESAEVVTSLDAYIVNGYLSTSVYDAKLFTGVFWLQGVEQILEKAVSVEVFSCLFEQEMDIPVLKRNSLRLFNRKTLQMTQIELNQTTRIDETTAYCYIGPITLLAVGGCWHNEVYEVNIKSGKVEKMPNMYVTRAMPGIINYRKCVYAIGGYTGSQILNTAEKYEIESKSWTSLSNSLNRAKRLCSVCEHSSGLYISGLEEKGSSIEYFNPIDQTFRVIRADSIISAAIMCCVGDEVYHIRQAQLEVASLSNGPNVVFTVKATIPQIGNGYYWLCCPLKVINGELISVLNVNTPPTGLFSLKPAQAQFTQIANFIY